MSKDPLATFKVWEGEELGNDRDTDAGFEGSFTTPTTVLHYAGGHVTSTAMGRNHDKPAVYIKLVTRAIGHDNYHVLDGIIESDVALELAESLAHAAVRARADIAAHNDKE